MQSTNYTGADEPHSLWRLRIHLFEGILNDNPERRKETLDEIELVFEQWVNNETNTVSPVPSTPDTTSSDGSKNDNGGKQALELYILTIFRMSINCPFADVRHAFTKLLEKLKEKGVPTPLPIYPYPSLYIPPEETFTLEWSGSDAEKSIGVMPDENVQNLMSETFISIGRLSNNYRTLFYFPTFAKKYQKAYNELVRSNGVLPRNYRYYIGIMAASRHKCQYLVSHLKNEYLFDGGDPEWLNGLEYVPAKIRKIDKINGILAHQPWRIKVEDIKELLIGDTPPENWSVAEVVHLIVLLSTFHSLSSYTLSCGIVPEYDSDGGFRRPPSWTTPSSDHEERGISVGLNLSEHTSEELSSGMGIRNVGQGPPSDNPVEEGGHEEPNDTQVEEENREENCEENREALRDTDVEEENNDEFANCEGEEAKQTPIPTQTLPSPPPPIDAFTKDFPLYLGSRVEVKDSDRVFSKKNLRQDLLSLSTFNWDQGIYMVKENLHFGGNNPHGLLDEEFKEIRKGDCKEIQKGDCKLLSSNSDQKDPDAIHIREAIWYYVFRLYGIKDDGYSYKNIGTYLGDEEIKNFIKKVCTNPEDFTYKDWNNKGFEMSTKEKCYVILICAEARKQAELLRGLWCVNEASG